MARRSQVRRARDRRWGCNDVPKYSVSVPRYQNLNQGIAFEMTRGIRQGFLVSPLICAVVVDILLRGLEAILNGRGITRAFADDTAAVLEDLCGFLLRVAQLFDEYAVLPGLFLNYGKAIIVPLWRLAERNYEDISRLLSEIAGEWAGR